MLLKNGEIVKSCIVLNQWSSFNSDTLTLSTTFWTITRYNEVIPMVLFCMKKIQVHGGSHLCSFWLHSLLLLSMKIQLTSRPNFPRCPFSPCGPAGPYREINANLSEDDGSSKKVHVIICIFNWMYAWHEIVQYRRIPNSIMNRINIDTHPYLVSLFSIFTILTIEAIFSLETQRKN